MCDIYRAVYMCDIYRGKAHVRSTELRRISRRTWQDCIGCVTIWQDCIWPVTHKTHSIGCVTSTELRLIWNVWLSQSQDSCNKTLLDVWHLQSQDSFRKKRVFGLLPTSFFFFFLWQEPRLMSEDCIRCVTWQFSHLNCVTLAESRLM